MSSEPKSGPALGDSRFIAFFDECGDHSLAKIDPDFPLFVLAVVVVERAVYRDVILPAFNGFKLRYFHHEGINLHSRDIRLAEGPFNILLNPHVRLRFLSELSAIMEAVPFTLLVSAIHKQRHLEQDRDGAANPYDLGLAFALERLAHFLERAGERTLPLIAEARGRNEDNDLRQVFFRVLANGTAGCSAERFKALDCDLHFQPKRNNLIGTQLADLCAYPCARHILNPEKQNRPYEIVRRKVYEHAGVSGWKLFPKN